jgi:hypothetical protein
MEVAQNNGIQADSTAQQTNTLNLSRTTLDFGGVDAFRVDSSRIQVQKPVAPIIKTIPYIPENDTISHPVYDVLNGDFVINGNESLISHLRLNPIEPINGDTQAIQVVNPPQMPVPAKPATEQELLRPAQSEAPAPTPEPEPVQADIAQTTADTAIYVAAEFPADTTVLTADTSVIAIDTAPEQIVKHKIFEEKEGKPLARRKTDSFAVTTSDTDWMIGVIITSFIIFAWIRMIYGKYLSMVFQSAANFFTANRVYSESNVVRGRLFVILNLLFYINTSLFACQCMDFYNFSFTEHTGWIRFCLSMIIIVASYWAKSIILKFIGFVFDNDGFGNYNFSVKLFCKVYGLLILPFIAVIPFVPDFVTEKLIWIGTALFVFLYALTLFRGLRICLRKGVSIFYLFFYLCALEILPLLAIYKYISNYLL